MSLIAEPTQPTVASFSEYGYDKRGIDATQTGKGGFDMREGLRLSVFAVERRQSGQAMVEYSLILVLVAVAAIAGLLTLGPGVSKVFRQTGQSFDPASQTCCQPGDTVRLAP